ncbi:30S ribosomal protein S6 modification protein [Vibrio cholerae]|nr:30S ribosomal protein S6 modification protein [Vibrio cholerae]
MFQHSKILVWYKIASQKVVLGEAHSDGTEDVVSFWLHAPTQFDNASNQGYWLSLFDDGGREIGNKWVSMRTADAILCGGNRARA